MKATMLEDPALVAPEFYKVLLENDELRVLDVRLGGGEETPMHSHPNYAIYTLSPGVVRFRSPDGQGTEVEFSSGEVLWRNAEEHAARNIGTTELHVLNIELKRSGKRGLFAGAQRERWNR